MNRHKVRFEVGAALLAALLAAGCSSSSEPTATPSSDAPAATSTAQAPAEPAAANGVEAKIDAVPWSKVGHGWTLATWSPVVARPPGVPAAPGDPDPETADTTLYLIDPAGNRYVISTLSGSDARLHLSDWSGDGTRALFTSPDSTTISVDLRTGEKTTIEVDGAARFTRPEGKALLVSTSFNGNKPGTLIRTDLTGQQQVSYPTENLGGAGQFSGRYLASPDGTQLVLGTANLGNELVPRSDDSLVVVANDGSIVRTIPTPMADADCAPLRWWAAAVVLAHCSAEGETASQLWEVPIDGSAPRALTAVSTGEGSDLGAGTAYRLPSGTFLQSVGACGTAFLSRLNPDGQTTRVDVPGMSQSVFVSGTTGDKLLLQGHLDCGGGTGLVSYDPATNEATALLGPPINGGSVTEAIVYPEGMSS